MRLQRTIDGDLTAQELIDGFRVYYNFIRPHMTLNGRTPAEEAGINLKGNKWLSLIQKAVNYNP